MTIPAYQAALLQAKAHRILRQAVAEFLEPFSISMLEWVLLSMLTKVEKPNLSELSHELGVEAPLITNLLNTLEKKGLITRTKNEEDKRHKTLAVTPAGDQLLVNTESHLNTKLVEYFHSVSAEDITAYLRVLKLIISNDKK